MTYLKSDNYSLTGTSITTSDSPYAMLITDEIIGADPDSGAIRIDMIAGTGGRLARINNLKTGGSASVDIYPNGNDLIQASAGSDPGVGPLSLSKGTSAELVFSVVDTAWLIM